AKRLSAHRARWVFTIGLAEEALTLAMCIWMCRAHPDTLIKVSRELMGVGIVGAIAMGAITGYLILSYWDRGGDYGGLGPPEPDPVLPADDLDAELRQLIEESQRDLGDPAIRLAGTNT